MPDRLKEIILDYQELPLVCGVPRRLKFETVPGKATVCIGVRRSGKSTFLFQRMQRLLDEGVPRENLLYLNFFDDRLDHLRRDGLSAVTEAYFSLYPTKKGNERIHCFFDEIQAIDGWESYVDRLMRTEVCEVHLTGSSARMLSKEIATQMRGRALSWELFPFSFAEFLDARGLAHEGAVLTKQRLLIQKAFDEFWTTGGFPEVIDESPLVRVRTHQEYFHAILLRDVVERHDAAHPRAVDDLARWLVNNAARQYSINRLVGYLKSLGHKVSKTLVGAWLEWFEDAFFMYSVSLYDASLARRQVNPKRVYCVDHALVTSVASGILVNTGHLLENLVFTALRRVSPELFYYRNAKGREVDFAVPSRGRGPRLVQVTETLADEATRRRETLALFEAMDETGTKSGTIVTRSEFETIEREGRTIEVVPAWRFLLDTSEA